MSQCGAKTRLGQPCRRPALAGATRCRLHGGASPQARSAARLRLVEREARQVLDREGIAPMVDPVAALLQLAGEVVQFKDWLGGRLADLRDDQWVSRTKLGAEQISAWTAAYERALDRTGRLLVDIGRLNLEGRLVALSESQGRMLAQVIELALQRCGLEDRQDLRAAIAAELRSVDSESLSTGPSPERLLLGRGRRLGLPTN